MFRQGFVQGGTLCLETDHAAVECSMASAYRPNRQMGRSHGDHRGHSDRSERMCYPLNDSRCSMPCGRYRHVCAKCHSGDNKAIQCSTYPAQKSGPNNMGRPAGPREKIQSNSAARVIHAAPICNHPIKRDHHHSSCTNK